MTASDDEDREEAQAGLPPSEAPRSADDLLGPLRGVLAELMRSAELGAGDVGRAISLLTEVAASTLDVDRASVWLYAEDRGSLTCANLYERAESRHSSGQILRGGAAPAYFRALELERSIAAHDAASDPRTQELRDAYLRPLGIGALLDAPVLLRGRLLGVVCTEHLGGPRRWRPWEELVAGTLADFVGMVFGAAEQNAQAQELRRYRDELERRVAERTRELEASREAVSRLFAASPVPMLLVSVEPRQLIALNGRAADLLGLTKEAAHALPVRAFWRDPAEADRLLTELAERGELERREVELVGPEERPVFVDVAGRAIPFLGAPALLLGLHDVTERKVAEERLRRLATTDELTGALNRRRFFEVAEDELARAARYDRPLSLAMLDADHFKTVNDRFGHARGDEVLRRLVETAQGQLRRTDVLARYGGEEIAVLLPETSRDAARATLERVRAAVAALALSHEGAPFSVTVSVGVVERRPGEALDALLQRADAALYEAKAQGRDRVVAA